MVCGKCGKGNRHTGPTTPELKKFAYLTPRQLRLLNGEPVKVSETPTEDTSDKSEDT